MAFTVRRQTVADYLPADGAVVCIVEGPSREIPSFLARRRRVRRQTLQRVGEPLAEDKTETDVVTAAAPLEVSDWRWIGWIGTAAALGRLSRAASLGDRVHQRGGRQRLDERLFTTNAGEVWKVLGSQQDCGAVPAAIGEQ